MVLEKRITDDGSYTFYNPSVDETYHSVSGAAQEAREKYTNALDLKRWAEQHREIRIIDFCFGLGYNTAAALDCIRSANPDCRIIAIGLELDPDILAQIDTLPDAFASFPVIRKAALSPDLSYTDDLLSLSIVLGDARMTLKDVPDKWADVVFFDPFSPKKAPTLWTLDVFRDLFRCMKKGGALATYSCARHVRENMRRTGLRVEDGPCVGRRSPSTIAYRDD